MPIANYKIVNNRWHIISLSQRFPVISELDFAIFHTTDITVPGKLPRHPRVLADIVLERRNLSTAHQYCIEHFGLMQNLRAVMLFKFFSRHPTTRREAAVAVLYRRAAIGPSWQTPCDSTGFSPRICRFFPSGKILENEGNIRYLSEKIR